MAYFDLSKQRFA